MSVSKQSNEKTISHVGLIIAMAEEAELIIEHFGLTLEENKLLRPGVIYSGSINNLQLSVLLNGIDERYQVNQIGPVPATLTAQYACAELQPDVLISAGTAGGFSARGAGIGTVYLSQDYCIFHDRQVPLPGYDASSVGCYPVLDVSAMAHALQIPQGVVSSGSSLLKKASDLAVMAEHNAVAKEMEAAAIAWVCELYDLPFFALKSITNLLDESAPSEEQFTKNLTTSTQALTESVIQVVAHCEGKSIKALGALA